MQAPWTAEHAGHAAVWILALSSTQLQAGFSLTDSCRPHGEASTHDARDESDVAGGLA
jgi:hypothetical protein